MKLGTKTIRTVQCLLAGTALISSATVFAQPADPSFSEPAPALADVLSSLDAVWNASGLGFTKVLFVDGPASRYGQYEPASAVFEPGAAMTVYAEPVGYGFTSASGMHRFELSASYELKNTTGQVLASQDGFATIGDAGRSKQREFQASLTFQFEGLPDGDYLLSLTLNDASTGKAGTADLPFQVKTAE